jgi:hypothetical protein
MLKLPVTRAFANQSKRRQQISLSIRQSALTTLRGSSGEPRNHARTSSFLVKLKHRQILQVAKLDSCPSSIKAHFFGEDNIDGQWIHWPLIPLDTPIFWSIDQNICHSGTSLKDVLELIDHQESENDWSNCPF